MKMAKKLDISKPQQICLDALKEAVDEGDISQIEADPMISKCNEPLAPKA
jgi:hypothetical protein